MAIVLLHSQMSWSPAKDLEIKPASNSSMSGGWVHESPWPVEKLTAAGGGVVIFLLECGYMCTQAALAGSSGLLEKKERRKRRREKRRKRRI